MIDDSNHDRPPLVEKLGVEPRAPRGDSLRRLASWLDLYRRGASEQERLDALGTSDPQEATRVRVVNPIATRI